ncbi:hypothetical protein Taro_054885 [Colocasia esculenta]|uniref:Uncharacterized protein n=1 Tax=Colocasia esculenta TaxID=4460 RepID=A0A843XRZ7_COLES|nr:hypothetical protein [Colocasia esculenta]
MKGSSGRPTNIECESSDEEEEYTSDECEDDDEDGVELDISYSAWSTIGLQFWEEPPWEGFVPGISFWFSICSGEFTPPQPRVPVAGPSSVSPTVAAAAGPTVVSPPLAAGLGQSTPSPNTVVGSVPEGVVSLQEGGGSFYESTLPEVWINGQQMTEKYAGEEEQPQLDLEVWVAASGAPKKGHVYGFGHSMTTSRVLSGVLSSASQTSAFSTAAGAPGQKDEELEEHLVPSLLFLDLQVQVLLLLVLQVPEDV